MGRIPSTNIGRVAKQLFFLGGGKRQQVILGNRGACHHDSELGEPTTKDSDDNLSFLLAGVPMGHQPQAFSPATSAVMAVIKSDNRNSGNPGPPTRTESEARQGQLHRDDLYSLLGLICFMGVLVFAVLIGKQHNCAPVSNFFYHKYIVWIIVSLRSFSSQAT